MNFGLGINKENNKENFHFWAALHDLGAEDTELKAKKYYRRILYFLVSDPPSMVWKKFGGPPQDNFSIYVGYTWFKKQKNIEV